MLQGTGIVVVMRSGGSERPSAPVGLSVKRRRKERGWTQQTLADAIGIDRVTVARVEKGEWKSLDEKTQDGLIRELGMTAAELRVEYYTQSRPGWLAAYLDSRWHPAIETTDAERDWLRTLPLSFWGGQDPTPEDVADEIQCRRKREARRRS